MKKQKKKPMKKNLKNRKKMVPLDYLSILNSETKEKLIGLCMNRKFIENFDEDRKTMYEEDKLGEEEAKEDEDIDLEQ